MLREGVSAVLTALVVACALAGCGSSSSGGSSPTPTPSPSSAAPVTANAGVCAARDDIAKQIDTLKGMTASTASLGAVRQSVSAIRTDLTKISTAAKDLAAQKRAQVEAAAQTFKDTVQTTATEVRSAGSFAAAKSTLTQAFSQMSLTFGASLGKLSC